MKAYTVHSTDDLAMEPLDHCVVGTYTSRGRALDRCADYMMDRLKLRDDLAWSMAHDENHPEAGEFFSERAKDGSVRTVVKRGIARRLREFLRNELGAQSSYYVWDGEASWHFDVDENDVEGELWHTVTWGDSDCEDPEFTTPWPESFTSEEAAAECFYRYALDLRKQHGLEVSKSFRSYVHDSLMCDGRCQVDLGDGRCVSCVLYRGDMENIKE